MKSKNDSGISEKLYHQLLKLYPRAFHDEFGKSMQQVFHDQCVEKRNTSGLFGLMILWLRVIPDLVFTSIKQHIVAFPSSLRSLVFDSPLWLLPLLLTLATIALTMTVPFGKRPLYESSAKIAVFQKNESQNFDPYNAQKLIQTILSYQFRKTVIERLDLDKVYQTQSRSAHSLTANEVQILLANNLHVEHLRNSDIFIIKVTDPDPKIAAKITGEISQTLNRMSFEQEAALHRQSLSDPNFRIDQTSVLPPIAIVENPTPSKRVRYPNTPKWIAFGIAVSTVIGIILLFTLDYVRVRSRIHNTASPIS